jgi:hypothetical protein
VKVNLLKRRRAWCFLEREARERGGEKQDKEDSSSLSLSSHTQPPPFSFSFHTSAHPKDAMMLAKKNVAAARPVGRATRTRYVPPLPPPEDRTRERERVAARLP